MLKKKFTSLRNHPKHTWLPRLFPQGKISSNKSGAGYSPSSWAINRELQEHSLLELSPMLGWAFQWCSNLRLIHLPLSKSSPMLVSKPKHSLVQQTELCTMVELFWSIAGALSGGNRCLFMFPQKDIQHPQNSHIKVPVPAFQNTTVFTKCKGNES